MKRSYILDVAQVVAYQKLGFVIVKLIVLRKKMSHHSARPQKESVVTPIILDATMENAFPNDGAAIMTLVLVHFYQFDCVFVFCFIKLLLSPCLADCSDKSDEINCTMRNCSESEFRYLNLFHEKQVALFEVNKIFIWFIDVQMDDAYPVE